VLLVDGSNVLGDISGAGATIVASGASLTTADFSQTGGLFCDGSATIDGTGAVGGVSGTGTLTLGSSSVLQLLQSAPGATSSVGTLTVDSGGTLDITDNALMITDDPSITTIQSLVESGSNGGTWNGTGITSSCVIPNSPGGSNYAADGDNGTKAVVYASSDSYTNSIPSGEIEVMYSEDADFNLDGSANETDYEILAHHWGATMAIFQQGDVNGDGTVNLTDYLLLAHDFNYSLNPTTGL
jgi:hypothetical protein